MDSIYATTYTLVRGISLELCHVHPNQLIDQNISDIKVEEAHLVISV